MKIFPPKLDERELLEGFANNHDMFQLMELAAGLTSLLKNVSDPLVISLDGKWGVGKSTFLKMWAGELRKESIPTIYFDAFENDFVDDAFAALVRAVIAFLEENTALETKIAQQFRKSAIHLGVVFGKGALKLGTKAAVRAASGGLLTDKDAEDAFTNNSDFVFSAGDTISEFEKISTTELMSLFDKFITSTQQQKNTVENFKKSLGKIPDVFDGNSDKKNVPVVFIIDELDRCRPDFALHLLERIKHVFSVENVHFVLGVHQGQLEQSVKFAYGSDIDASLYLQKFVNLRIPFEEGKMSTRVTTGERIRRYITYLVRRLELPDREGKEQTIEFIKNVAVFNDFSLRTVERVFTNFALSLAFSEENELYLGPIVGGLAVLKVVKPELFQKARVGLLKFEEIELFFNFSGETEDEWARSWWFDCLNNVSERKRTMTMYSFREPVEIVTYTANSILSRLSPTVQ